MGLYETLLHCSNFLAEIRFSVLNYVDFSRDVYVSHIKAVRGANKEAVTVASESSTRSANESKSFSTLVKAILSSD